MRNSLESEGGRGTSVPVHGSLCDLAYTKKREGDLWLYWTLIKGSSKSSDTDSRAKVACPF